MFVQTRVRVLERLVRDSEDLEDVCLQIREELAADRPHTPCVAGVLVRWYVLEPQEERPQGWYIRRLLWNVQ